MKNIKICFLLSAYISTVSITAQDLHINTGSTITVTAGEQLRVVDGLTIESTGILQILSNETKSGSLIVEGSSTGDITYKRYLGANKWLNISSPVTNQSVNSFVTNQNNDISTAGDPVHTYGVSYYKNTNIAGKRWTYHSPAGQAVNQEDLTLLNNGNLKNGQGYSMKRDAAGTFSFTGELATDNVVIDIDTETGGHNWHSIGNPYPSYLPGNNPAVTTNNVLSSNQNNLDPNYVALYIWIDGQHIPVNQLSESFYLAPGQGFLIHSLDNDDTFTFNESYQSHQSGDDDFERTTDNQIPSILLSLSDGTTQNTTELKYIESATTGLDPGYDAGTYYSSIPDLTIDSHLVSDSQGIDFALQCLPDNSYESIIVPISVRASINSELSFSALVTDLPTSIDVYLEDTVKNTFTKISEEPYEVTADDGVNGIGRFFIHTSQNTMSTTNLAANLIQIFKISNEQLGISGTENLGALTVTMYTVNGKELMLTSLSEGLEHNVALPSSLSSGVYIIRVKSNYGVQTKKIIIE
jgi:hypothetical protein